MKKMNKYLTFTIVIAVVSACALILCACSNFGRKKDPDDANGTGGYPEDVQLTETEKLVDDLNGAVDLDSLTLDELLALYDRFLSEDNDSLNDGTGYDLYYRDTDVVPGGAENEIGFDHSDGAQTAVYSDAEWKDKDVESLDVTEGMSAEEKAQYEAAVNELDSFDADEFQREIDDMLKDMEEFEDYEPYDPEEHGTGDGPSFLNEWPDNEIAKQVPKPPFEDPLIVADDSSITVVKTEIDIDSVKQYVDSLKKAGFTLDANEDTNGIEGYVIYSYTAGNENGITVSLTFATDTVTVSISR